jgi:hypothetical protein
MQPSTREYGNLAACTLQAGLNKRCCCPNGMQMSHA